MKRNVKIDDENRKSEPFIVRSRKEILITLLIFNLFCFSTTFLLFEKNIQFVFCLFPLLLLVLIDIFFCLYLYQEKLRIKKKEKEEMMGFLLFLEFNMRLGYSFEKSLEKTMSLCSDSFCEKIRKLSHSMSEDFSIHPFQYFFDSFSIRFPMNLCHLLYTLSHSGTSGERMNELSAINRKMRQELMKNKEKEVSKTLAMFDLFPFFATFLFSLIILAQIANIIGGILHG